MPGPVPMPVVAEPMLNPDTLFAPLLPTYKNVPAGSATSGTGVGPVLAGTPAIAVKTPVAVLMVNPETVLSRLFVAYKNFAEGGTNSRAGPFPALKGEPAIVVSTPV